MQWGHMHVWCVWRLWPWWRYLPTNNNTNINNGATENSFIWLFTVSLVLCDFTCISLFIFFHSNILYDNPKIIAYVRERDWWFRRLKDFAQGHLARTQGWSLYVNTACLTSEAILFITLPYALHTQSLLTQWNVWYLKSYFKKTSGFFSPCPS